MHTLEDLRAIRALEHITGPHNQGHDYRTRSVEKYGSRERRVIAIATYNFRTREITIRPPEYRTRD